MKYRIWMLLLAAVFTGVEVAEAQVFTPSYLSPRSAGDYGIYINDGPGDFSVEGVMRIDLGIHDFGIRGGVASGNDVRPLPDTDGAHILLGADIRSPFQVEDVPIEFAFGAGAQGILGEASQLGGTVGVTIGYTFVPGDFTFTPYVHPRLGVFGGDGFDGLEASFLGDIGIDFAFAPGVNFRLGFGLGNETANWGLGVSWR